MREKTLRLKLPFGKTLLLLLLFFILFLGAGEVVARSRIFRSYFTTPTWGNRHRHLEIQLTRLQNIVNSEGSIDCIFLGNSMVWRGFNPVAFRKAYQEQTGDDLRCFNFGIDGLPASSAGVLVNILVDDFQPQLLIYGTDARDYAVPVDAKDAVAVLDSDWIRYRNGDFSIIGWLVDHSSFYRYSGSIQRLMRFEHRFVLRRETDTTSEERYGFDVDETVGDYVKTPPDPGDPRGHIQYYFGLLSEYQVRSENLDGLIQIVSQAEKDIQVIVIEMPVPPTYMNFFGNGKEDHQFFIQQVGGFTEATGVSFWQTNILDLVPDDGWVDYSHLNNKGSYIFSDWLGRQLGGAAQQGLLSLGNPENPETTR